MNETAHIYVTLEWAPRGQLCKGEQKKLFKNKKI
jgi:hypothetical protein